MTALVPPFDAVNRESNADNNNNNHRNSNSNSGIARLNQQSNNININNNNNNNNSIGSNNNNDLLSYSFQLCSIFGIPILIHYLLPLFFVLSFFFWSRIIAADSEHFGYYVGLILAQNAVLWWTVLIHEFGHAFAGYIIGGHTEKILLWPLGGLAFTSPPSSSSSNSNGYCHSIIIALGGPLTHIPHMLFWGLLFFDNAQKAHAGVVVKNPFAQNETWNQTIFTPITDWFSYDFLMLSFTLNFWLFVINLLLPAYPLDGSRIFVNLLKQRFGLKTCAQIYCGVNACLGMLFIVLSYAWLSNGSMCQFAGLWAMFQVYIMVQLIIQNREFAHPLFLD